MIPYASVSSPMCITLTNIISTNSANALKGAMTGDYPKSPMNCKTMSRK